VYLLKLALASQQTRVQWEPAPLPEDDDTTDSDLHGSQLRSGRVQDTSNGYNTRQGVSTVKLSQRRLSTHKPALSACSAHLVLVSIRGYSLTLVLALKLPVPKRDAVVGGGAAARSRIDVIVETGD
jgi:hypothetical protein